NSQGHRSAKEPMAPGGRLKFGTNRNDGSTPLRFGRRFRKWADVAGHSPGIYRARHLDHPATVRNESAFAILELLEQSHNQHRGFDASQFTQKAARNPQLVAGFGIRYLHFRPRGAPQDPLITLDSNDRWVERKGTAL